MADRGASLYPFSHLGANFWPSRISTRHYGVPGSSYTRGVRIVSYEWILNMPTDHATVELNSVWVPGSAVFGSVDQGLAMAQTFVHENRIRQAASSCGPHDTAWAEASSIGNPAPV